MRFISAKTHGYMDYIVGILLILAPWIFQFSAVDSARIVSVTMGVITIIMSLFTNYPLGLVKTIPFNVHLTADVICGIFLALSPWIFGFSNFVFWPHLILGLLEIGAGLMTVTTLTSKSFKMAA